jgi:hypothetical protein
VRWNRLRCAMTLSRQGLAKVDRHLLSRLDHEESVQLVKVPVSNAVWSTWRRYCEAVGIPMGRGLALLLQRELGSLVDEDLERAKGMLTQKESDLVTREEALGGMERALLDRERSLATKERLLAARISQQVTPRSRPATPSLARQGRNEPCSCGSGKKFKYCHGRS